VPARTSAGFGAERRRLRRPAITHAGSRERFQRTSGLAPLAARRTGQSGAASTADWHMA